MHISIPETKWFELGTYNTDLLITDFWIIQFFLGLVCSLFMSSFQFQDSILPSV